MMTVMSVLQMLNSLERVEIDQSLLNHIFYSNLYKEAEKINKKEIINFFLFLVFFKCLGPFPNRIVF